MKIDNKLKFESSVDSYGGQAKFQERTQTGQFESSVDS